MSNSDIAFGQQLERQRATGQAQQWSNRVAQLEAEIALLQTENKGAVAYCLRLKEALRAIAPEHDLLQPEVIEAILEEGSKAKAK